LGDQVEVEGLVEGRGLSFNLVAFGEMGKGVFEQLGVFGEGEGFDGDEGLEQGRAESFGGFELSGQGGTELFVVTGAEEGEGFGREAVPVIFEEAREKRPVDTSEDVNFGEEMEFHRKG